MLLKEALEIHKNSKGKIDILETLGIKIKNNYFENNFYINKVEQLPKGDYFISDLDGTFFRGTLIKEAFSLFSKYLRDQSITNINLMKYKEFLDDYKLFKSIEKEAYNKEINYNDYLNSGLFIINKYHDQVEWDEFLLFLKDYFHRKEKVNPFRFSIKKMKEVLESGNQFLFISGASSFVFEIYLDLLKKYVGENIGEQYVNQIHGISSYVNLEKKEVYNMWNMGGKYDFIGQLKKKGFINKIIGGMGDTSSDYGISNHLGKGVPFYFMNPAHTAITEFNKIAKKDVDFHFITERKDIIFEYDIENIRILN